MMKDTHLLPPNARQPRAVTSHPEGTGPSRQTRRATPVPPGPGCRVWHATRPQPHRLLLPPCALVRAPPLRPCDGSVTRTRGASPWRPRVRFLAVTGERNTPRGSGRLHPALRPPLQTQDPTRKPRRATPSLARPRETPHHAPRRVQSEQGTCSPPLLRHCPCHRPRSRDPEPPTPGSPGSGKPEDTERGRASGHSEEQQGPGGLRRTPNGRPRPTEGGPSLPPGVRGAQPPHPRVRGTHSLPGPGVRGAHPPVLEFRGRNP